MRALIAATISVVVVAAAAVVLGVLAAATAAAEPCPDTAALPAVPAAAVPPGVRALRAGPAAVSVADGQVCQPAAAAPTTPASGGGADAAFDPGNIASDEVFYNSDAMTVQQVAAFIDTQGADCTGPWCLRNLLLKRESRPADQYCQAYPGGPGQSAAQFIVEVARACGINPQVLLVTLQKESGGVTRIDATESTWAAAWGWHCPDTGPGGTANCDPQHAGFVNQGYGMAHQWARYRVDIPTGKYSYQPGRTYEILWNVVESGCGAAPVTIANLATASLYTYTPYQPNAASLAAYPGEGDACSSYGNRNFFRLFQEWFGSTGGGLPTSGDASPAGAGEAAGGQAPVTATDVTVVLPVSPHTVWRGRDYAGTVITAPTSGVAAGIAAGLAYLGLQYSWGGGNAAGPTKGIRDGGVGDSYGDYDRVGFDCSGLTTYVAARYPVVLPRTSYNQRTSAPQQVPWEQALPGDLVGYDGHIAVYLGVVDGQRLQLESPQSGDYVKVSGVRSDADTVVHRWWTT